MFHKPKTVTTTTLTTTMSITSTSSATTTIIQYRRHLILPPEGLDVAIIFMWITNSPNNFDWKRIGSDGTLKVVGSIRLK